MQKPHSFHVLAGAITLALLMSFGVRAQQQQQPQQTAPQGPTAAEKYKNIQTLKIRADQLPDTMQYFSAALGVQCNFCHAQGPNGLQFDSDDKNAKKTARKMVDMVVAFNAGANDITLTCATCHHGRQQPERTPPLAVEMTPEEVSAAAARSAQRQGGPGEARGAAPQGAPTQAGAPNQARGRGGPPRPSETADQVLEKYVTALGGESALAAAKTRVLKGTATTRDRVSTPITVQEKATGEYRIDVDAKPQPIVRVASGKEAWIKAFGNVHDLEGVQAGQVARPTDFGLALNMKQRYQSLQVQRYGTIDGTPTISVNARVNTDVVEQMQFDRENGLLKRRTIQTRTPFGALVEQVDYSDYRDVSGVKVPFEITHTTWNQVTTEKFTDAKINAPVDDSVFAKK